MVKWETLAKVLLVVIVIVTCLWILSTVFGFLYDAVFAWWLEPLQDLVGAVQDVVLDVYNAAYEVTDNVVAAISPGGVPLGLDGRTDNVTLGEGLVTGIVTTLGNVANWFLNLFGFVAQGTTGS